MKCRQNTGRWSTALALALCLAGACRRGAQGGDGGEVDGGTLVAEAPPQVPFELREDSADLTLLWFDEHGAPHAAGRISEVPEAHRDLVRVDPLQPEQRAAGWVYLADVRTRGASGLYVVRAVQTESLAAMLGERSGLARLAQPPPPPATAQGAAAGSAPSGAAAQGQPRVVLYGASWCGACHQAAEYMRSRHIPFVEHDIEREPQAAQELATHAREQGVNMGSIPIISIDGRLMVGFNPQSLEAALARRG